METKTITCDNCRGTGEYHTDQRCVRCNGKGVLTSKRLDHLQFVYYPKRLDNGTISPVVFEREIKSILWLREHLGEVQENIGGEPIGTGPVLLDAIICSKHGITLDTTVRELKAKFHSLFVEEF